MRTTYSSAVVAGFLVAVTLPLAAVGGRAGVDRNRYFTIRVVDEDTGRGVPLVELRTVNDIRLWTDSAGVVALREPGLMGHRLGLSPVVVLISLLFWGFVWGLAGTFLAVPLTMVLRILCENTDDLTYVMSCTGEDCLMIGTDYGHHDPSTELNAIHLLRNDKRLTAAAIGKILDKNPRTFYGLNGSG